MQQTKPNDKDSEIRKAISYFEYGIKCDIFQEPVLTYAQTAISALEKQIPKKPIKKNPICYEKTKDGQEYFAFDYFCPNCNEKIELFEHHCKCGHALDWSNTNENNRNN